MWTSAAEHAQSQAPEERNRRAAMIAQGGLRPRYRNKFGRFRLALTRNEPPAKATLLRALGQEAYARHPNREAPPPHTQREWLSN